MKPDFYIKLILTVIAACLIFLCCDRLFSFQSHGNFEYKSKEKEWQFFNKNTGELWTIVFGDNSEKGGTFAYYVKPQKDKFTTKELNFNSQKEFNFNPNKIHMKYIFIPLGILVLCILFFLVFRGNFKAQKKQGATKTIISALQKELECLNKLIEKEKDNKEAVTLRNKVIDQIYFWTKLQGQVGGNPKGQGSN